MGASTIYLAKRFFHFYPRVRKNRTIERDPMGNASFATFSFIRDSNHFLYTHKVTKVHQLTSYTIHKVKCSFTPSLHKFPVQTGTSGLTLPPAGLQLRPKKFIFVCTPVLPVCTATTGLLLRYPYFNIYLSDRYLRCVTGTSGVHLFQTVTVGFWGPSIYTPSPLPSLRFKHSKLTP